MSEQEEIIQITVSSDDSGTRLDAFLAGKIESRSRSQLQKLIDEEDVVVNGETARSSYKVREGDVIDVELTLRDDVRFEPENIALDIVFEDDSLAVINKPAGMIVHPGAGVSGGTLANAIAWHFRSEPPASAGGSDRIGIVHRLDKDTSGLIVVAKNIEMQEALSAAFRDREVEKRYVALVHGSPRENSGAIDRPIARDRWHRTKMTVAANGRSALTLWKIRERFEKFTLLDVEIKTGRTHQIRVHLASINHPVVGDSIYNEGRDNSIANNEVRKAVEHLGRFFLHSAHLAFDHPKTGERMHFTSELPQELAQLLKML
ncbi:MAG: RluA family pseudouridine synthase [Chloracidobacterium sp.]|nr:RluA family pseudouridine synthase [Chloracidobacterium sp.]MCO5334242.1 RluA family pseudouridine synthase [Pyrinomonadaceae bacterium]